MPVEQAAANFPVVVAVNNAHGEEEMLLSQQIIRPHASMLGDMMRLCFSFFRF